MKLTIGRWALPAIWLTVGVFLAGNTARSEDLAGRAVVVWISVDGVRHDYPDRVDTPFLDKLQKEGAYSRELISVFPSLTFPSHASQATGVNVDQHGIPLNNFYDSRHDRSYVYPGFANLLQSEAIWNTAQRQGRRTAVLDWVMSFYQRGRNAASHFGRQFDSSLSDQERLEALLDAWKRDRGTRNPYQLIMGYMIGTDSIGHEFGPDSPEVDEGMKRVDELLGWFAGEALDLFTSRMNAEDTLYLIVTTDHGMSAVEWSVNPLLLAGLDREDETSITVISGGNMAHYFLNKIRDATQRNDMKNQILANVRQHDFLEVYEKEAMPESWGYAHPTRVGDIVVALKKGYSFSRRVSDVVVPVAETGGPLGMHGYDPEDPEMFGIAYFWRYPEPYGGVDLGRVHSLQLHPTVAALLGIEPAPRATAEPVALPGLVK